MRPISDIFTSGDRYSTSQYTTLISTTFKLFSRTYCIHCGKIAKAVQGGLSNLVNGEGKYYDTTDHRCTCNDAIDEMAENLAACIGGFESDFSENLVISREHYLQIIQSLSNTYLPLSDNGESRNGLSPKIIKSSPRTTERFLDEASKHTIKIYLQDDYYKDTPLARFLKMVESRIEQKRQEKLEALQKEMAKISEPISIL